MVKVTIQRPFAKSLLHFIVRNPKSPAVHYKPAPRSKNSGVKVCVRFAQSRKSDPHLPTQDLHTSEESGPAR